MNNVVILLIASLVLVGCNTFRGGSSMHSSGTRLLHHSEDTKGQRYFPEHREATGNEVIIFEPDAGAWAAYDKAGNRVKTGLASGGKDFCPDLNEACRTKVGQFSIFRKQGADCESSQFPIETNGGASMPYCMHFHGGYAIHGSYQVPEQNASHGCIRILPSAAKWLNTEFAKIGTTIIVQPYDGI